MARNHKAIFCDPCNNLWAHIKCENICAKTYTRFMAAREFYFICNPCLQNELPFPEGLDENPDIEVPVVDLPPNYLDDEALTKSISLKF